MTFDERQLLEAMLRPAAGGLYVVSTGKEEQLSIQRRLYRASTEEEIRARFEEGLSQLEKARCVVLGVPSDVGAGYLRGANVGPQAIRLRLLEDDPDWPERATQKGILDLGDVFVVPQLLHDEMLSEAQQEATRRALYPDLPRELARQLPVSPLSIAERVLDVVLAVNPRVKPFLIGGDHSTAWPMTAALGKSRREPWGIVQSDAHTDLLPERLGVRYCFATWSYHANELLGRGGRLVQVGLRASRHDRGHWESTLGVRQFWAEECLRQPEAALEAILAQVRATGARAVYFSNDIDGTDARYADATGTPEPGGLEPDFVVELIRRLGRQVGLCAGDVVEVAPPIQRTPEGARRTVGLAVRYLKETLGAMLGEPV